MRRVLGEATVPLAVARLQAKFEYPERKLDPQPALRGFGGGGVVPTLMLAASNSAPWVIEGADFVCLGTADHDTINDALRKVGNNKSRILLAEGDFFIDPFGLDDITSLTHLQGVGQWKTRIHVTGPGTASTYGINLETQGKLSDFSIEGEAGYLGDLIVSSYGTLANITFAGTAATGLRITGGQEPTQGLNFSAPIFSNASIEIDGDSVYLDGIVQVGGVTGDFIRIETTAGHECLMTGLLCVMDVGGTPNGVVFAGTGADHVVMSGFAIHTPNGSAILVDGTDSFSCVITDGYLEGDYGVRTLSTDSFVNLTMGDLKIIADTSGLDVRVQGGNLHDIEIEDFSGGGTGTGARIGSTSEAPLHVTNLTVKDFDLDGVEFHGVAGFGRLKNLKASHIDVRNVGNHGIVLNNVHNGRLSNSKTRDIGTASDNTYDGILITGESIRNLVTGCQPIPAAGAPNTRYGVNVETTEECNMVVGNDFGDPDDYGTDALNDNGANTQLFWPADATYGDNFTDCGTGS